MTNLELELLMKAPPPSLCSCRRVSSVSQPEALLPSARPSSERWLGFCSLAELDLSVEIWLVHMAISEGEQVVSCAAMSKILKGSK